MDKESSDERIKEHSSLLRQGAGHYANLCGVLAGFVAVIIVLVLTPGFFPKTEASILYEFMVILFSISAFGYIMTALLFISISITPLWHYKSLEKMKTDFAFGQALWLLFTLIFLGGVSVLSFSLGTFYVGIVVIIGVLFMAWYLIKEWWALARRPPPKKTKHVD